LIPGNIVPTTDRPWYTGAVLWQLAVRPVGRGRPSRETSTVFKEQADAALSGDSGVVEAMPSETSGGIFPWSAWFSED
jgi:hypothetical protein